MWKCSFVTKLVWDFPRLFGIDTLIKFLFYSFLQLDLDYPDYLAQSPRVQIIKVSLYSILFCSVLNSLFFVVSSLPQAYLVQHQTNFITVMIVTGKKEVQFGQ